MLPLLRIELNQVVGRNEHGELICAEGVRGLIRLDS